MHKAKLFSKLPGAEIVCNSCQRYCHIGKGKTGFCLVRKNINGQLFSLNYGISSGIQIDPMEKKPLYHYYPGSRVLSIGSWGCNFRCRQCQNWRCSWGAVEKLKELNKQSENMEDYISAEKLVNMAKKNNCGAIAFTFNEPTIWPEYVHDAAKLAKKEGLHTVLVSNGSFTREFLSYTGKYIDAANIDIKGWGEKSYTGQGGFWGKLTENITEAFRKYHIHLELTTLIIPGVNDSETEINEIASFIVKGLGRQIPWHISRFAPGLAPDKEYSVLPPTPVATLKKAYLIGKSKGLNFIYVWAPPENKNESLFSIGDTKCPGCGRLVVKRDGWHADLIGVKKNDNYGVCAFCNQDLYLKYN